MCPNWTKTWQDVDVFCHPGWRTLGCFLAAPHEFCFTNIECGADRWGDFFLFPACSFGTPLAAMLTEQRRTIRKQYETLQQRRALQDMTNHDHCKASLKAGSEVNAITPVSVTPCQEVPLLHLNTAQKLQLQQQLQQVCHLESTNVPFDASELNWDHGTACVCLLACAAAHPGSPPLSKPRQSDARSLHEQAIPGQSLNIMSTYRLLPDNC